MTNHAHRRPSLNRRQFLGRSGMALGGLAFGPALLTACGDDIVAPRRTRCESTRRAWERTSSARAGRY